MLKFSVNYGNEGLVGGSQEVTQLKEWNAWESLNRSPVEFYTAF